MVVKMTFPAAFVGALLLVGIPSLPVFAGGSRDGAKDGSVSRAAAGSLGEPRILAAYVIDDTKRADQGGSKAFVEGMYLPQAAAAYFPTPFSVSAKERRLSFDSELPYRILSRSDLGSGVRLFTIETSAAAPALSSAGRSYSFTFPRSALGRDGETAMQPAPYALERAIRISELSKGVARIESLRYDEAAGQFKTNVYIGP